MSGYIDGTRSGNRPYLRIRWNVENTDIGNNRTLVRLRLFLMHPYNVVYSATKTGKLFGASFSSSTNVNGTGETHLQTRDVWVSHNGDGTKTQNFHADFNIAINFDGWLGSLTVNQNVTLPTIPRASSLNSFKVDWTLQPNTNNTLSLSLSRASSSFTHDIALVVNNNTVQRWNGQGLPTSLTINSTAVNQMLSLLNTTSKGTATLRVWTKNGSNTIGGTLTRNAEINVHSSVTPNVSSLRAWINGSGKDNTIGRYVQSITRVSASFTSGATGGAYIVSEQVHIRKKGSNASNHTDVQVIHSSNGTTSRAVNENGVYQAMAVARDSRGRESFQYVEFTVQAYSSPKISLFRALRDTSNQTIVKITRNGSHSDLGGLNRLTGTVERRTGLTGAYATVASASFSNHPSGTFGSTINDTGASETLSYGYRFTVRDEFGNSATSTQTVSTSSVLMSFREDRGVGIGKMHERGILDIKGDIYHNGMTSGDRLWNGVMYMFETQQVKPSRRISECPNGWVLVWSAYNGSVAEDHDWQYTYVHKAHVKNHSGDGVMFSLARDNYAMKFLTKYVYITDDNIGGNRHNSSNRDMLVMREVLAW